MFNRACTLLIVILIFNRINDIRSIQQRFNELSNNCSTLDKTGVQTNRLRRIPNTANLSSEFFCIPISTEDIHAGLNIILMLAKQMRNLTFQYGTNKQTWKELKPIEMSDIEVTPPKPPGELPILPCMYSAIMVENPSHYARVYLTQWYRDILAMGEREIPAEQQKEITEIIMKEFETIASQDEIWLDWDANLTKRYVEGIVSKGYHAPSCKGVLIPQGYCVGKCWRYSE